MYLDIDKEYKIHIQAHHHLACKKRTCRTRGSCFGGSVVLTPGHLLVTHPHRLARQVEIRYKDRWRISTWPIWILLFLSYCLAQYSHAPCSPPASSASRICAWLTCSIWLAVWCCDLAVTQPHPIGSLAWLGYLELIQSVALP